MKQDIHIWIGPSVCNNEVKAFFQTDDDILHIKDIKKATWQDIGVEIGLFTSKTNARKNKFFGVIKHGYHEKLRIGKLKRNIFVFVSRWENEIIIDEKDNVIADKSKDWIDFCDKWADFLDNKKHTRNWRLQYSHS